MGGNSSCSYSRSFYILLRSGSPYYQMRVAYMAKRASILLPATIYFNRGLVSPTKSMASQLISGASFPSSIKRLFLGREGLSRFQDAKFGSAVEESIVGGIIGAPGFPFAIGVGA